jgi:hypothetical protein
VVQSENGWNGLVEKLEKGWVNCTPAAEWLRALFAARLGVFPNLVWSASPYGTPLEINER